MSIATRIQSMSDHIEDAYDELSRIGVDLTNTNKNLQNISTKLQEQESLITKDEGEGSNLSLKTFGTSQLDITPKGNTSQEVIAKVEGTTVEGTSISVNDVDSSKENTIIPKGACEQDSYTGKNKFVIPDTTTYREVTLTKNSNGTFNIKGTATGGSATFQIYINTTLASGTYTLSKNNTNNNLKFYVQDRSNQSWISNMIALESGSSVTSNITPTGNQTYFIIEVPNGATVDLENVEVLLESGSAVTSWEPYVGGIPAPNPDYPQDIRVVTGENSFLVQNKNLFDKSKMTNGGINRSTGEFVGWNSSRASDYIEIDPSNTYYLSIVVFVSETNGFAFYDKNKAFISGITARNLINNIPSNAKYFRFCFRIDGSYPSDPDEVQFEIGTIATTYVAHAEQTYTLHLGTNYLAGIGTYKDEIVGKTDEWKIKRYVGKVVFTGAENWGFENFTNYYRANIVVNDIKKTSNYDDTSLFSNYFTASAQESVGKMFHFGKTKYCYFLTSETSNTNWKNWLSTHNTELYYILATPTEETITDQTLITDLNNLYQATNYNGTTNISVEIAQGNAQPYLEYHYNYVTQKPSPDRPSEVKVVTGDNSVVVQNKNMFVSNLPATSTTFKGITVTRNNDEYTVTGTASGNATITITNVLPKLLANETYTMSVQIIEGTMGGNIVTAVYNEDGTTSYNYFNLSASRLSQSVSSNSNKTIRALEIYVASGLQVNYKFKLQLEKGSTASEHVIHAEQTYTLHLGTEYLAGIGDYKDEIVGKTDEWKIRRNVGKVIAIGESTEGWALAASYTDNTRFNSSGIILNKTNRDLLCNYFVKGTGGTDTTNIDVNGTSGELMITIPKTLASTKTEFEIWLSTHNTIIYYVLATPTEETITDPTLINQLNAIYAATGYEGTTNIITVSSKAPLLLEVESYGITSPTLKEGWQLVKIGSTYTDPEVKALISEQLNENY